MTSGDNTSGLSNNPPDSRGQCLSEIARLFLRLGFTAFGGPAAHIAMMEDEVVHRRRWIDRQHFLDLVAAINFIPGPSSTELAIQIGLIRGGFAGLVTAGFCFIVPAMLIILPIAWAYVHYSADPKSVLWVRGMMDGVNAAVIAVIVAACIRFAKTAMCDRFTMAVGTLAFIAQLYLQRFPHLQPELIVLAAAGIAGAAWYERAESTVSVLTLPLFLSKATVGASAQSASAGLFQMAGFFLKVGATLVGSGYVLVSYLQSGVVDQHGWLTHQQLLDAVAVGQFTPGPLLTTATFVGYLRGYQLFHSPAGGILGGVVATLCIFLPSFFFVALIGPLLPRIRRSPLARGAFNGMNAAVVALIAVVAIRLGYRALWPITIVNLPVAIAGLLAIVLWNINATWVILFAAVAGLLSVSWRHLG